MLFMHKDADLYVNHAVYSGKRPKGNEASYIQINPQNRDAVVERVMSLVPLIGIKADCKINMIHVLDEWIKSTGRDDKSPSIYKMMDKGGMDERKSKNIIANWRYYNNYIDLVLSLYGEYSSRGNLEIENNVAKMVLESASVRDHTRSVARKLSEYAEKVCDESELDGLLVGAYKSLHSRMEWGKWTDGCTALEVKDLVPFLYDICSKLKLKLEWEEAPMGGGKITKDNMRMNVSTPDEDSDWTSGARWADVPVWAGPSYTTHFILTVAKESGATGNEIRALAYSVFAYWNQCYPHTATPVHRLYGVMTAAREFGVPGFACEPKQIYLHAVSFSSL